MISVCVPTYNGQRFLSEAIASALAQTVEDIEVIVVDDASTDGSVEIAREFAARDTRVRVYRNAANLGLVGNWNRSVQLARAEWIKFLFQDDYMAPDCLSRLLGLAVETGRALVFCERNILIEPDALPHQVEFFEKRLTRFADVFPNQLVVSPEELSRTVLSNLTNNFFGEPTSALVRRACFLRHGLFNDQLFQMCDLEYWLRVGCNEGVAFLPERLATFRVHASSTTAVNFATSARRFRMAIEDVTLYHAFLADAGFASLRSADPGASVCLQSNFLEAIRVVERTLSVTEDPVERAKLDGVWQATLDRNPGIDLVRRSLTPPWRTALRQLKERSRRLHRVLALQS